MRDSTRCLASDEQRLARVGAVVALLAVVDEGPVSDRRLGTLVHDVRADEGPAGLDAEAVAVFDAMPMFFSLREGWTSQELDAAVTDGVALGALRALPGGQLELGHLWREYIRPPHAASHVSVVQRAE